MWYQVAGGGECGDGGGDHLELGQLLGQPRRLAGAIRLLQLVQPLLHLVELLDQLVALQRQQPHVLVRRVQQVPVLV